MHLDAFCILAAGLLVTRSAAEASGSGTSPSATNPAYPLKARQTSAANDTGYATISGNSTASSNSTDNNSDDGPNAAYMNSFIWTQADIDAENAEDANYDDPGLYSNASLSFPPPFTNWTVPAGSLVPANETTPVHSDDNSTSVAASSVPLSTSGGMAARATHLNSFKGPGA